MKVKISEICEIYDGPHATPKNTEEGPIFLGIKNINERCELDFTETKHLSEEDYIKWTKRVTPQENDIVFSYEATLNRYALIPKDFYGCLGRRLAICRVKRPEVVDAHYLYHYFCSPEWKSFILAHKVIGSTVLRVSIEDFPEYEIELPDINRQRQIAQVLDAMTEKIRINNEICTELDDMLKSIYDYWFVQFEYPGKNGKTYKSDGGKFCWSDVLNREIPVGWTVSTFDDISELIWGQCPDGKDILPIDTTEENVVEYCSGAGDMRSGIIVDCQAKTYVSTSKRTAYKDSVLISVAGSIGAIAIADHDISLGRAALALRPMKPEYKSFIYPTLKLLSNQVNNLATGSIQKVINSDHLKEMRFPINNDVLSDYCFQTKGIMDEIIQCSLQNKEISLLKEYITPLLMSGQLLLQ